MIKSFDINQSLNNKLIIKIFRRTDDFEIRSQHERRMRRVAQLRRRRRSSSYDVASVVPNQNKSTQSLNELCRSPQVVPSVSHPIQPCMWDVSTSSGCSSDSGSDFGNCILKLKKNRIEAVNLTCFKFFPNYHPYFIYFF